MVELITTLLNEGPIIIIMALHKLALTLFPGRVRLDLRDGVLKQGEVAVGV